MSQPDDSTLHQFEAALASAQEGPIELTLFVSGASDLSARAIANVKRFCEANLTSRYELAVVDVQEDLEALLDSQVLAAPTLVKTHPLPERRIVGDLSRPEMVLQALGLPAPPDGPAAG